MNAPRICSFPECGRPSVSRGLCPGHRIQREKGRPLAPLRLTKVGPKPTSVMTRFWKHVEQTDTCWLWTGWLNNRGYGQMAVNRRLRMFAHRLSWELHNQREIPAGMDVDHLCFNPQCVNPEHLEVVTPAENTRRAARRITECPQGHPYSGDNLITSPTESGGQRRYCRACRDRRNQQRPA